MWFGGGRRNGAMHEQLKGIFPLNPLTNILHKHAKRSLFTNAFHDHTSRTRFTITLHEHALRSHFTNMLHEHASRYVFLFHPLPCLRAPDKHANAKEILNGLAKPRSVWLLQPSIIWRWCKNSLVDKPVAAKIVRLVFCCLLLITLMWSSEILRRTPKRSVARIRFHP